MLYLRARERQGLPWPPEAGALPGRSLPAPSTSDCRPPHPRDGWFCGSEPLGVGFLPRPPRKPTPGLRSWAQAHQGGRLPGGGGARAGSQAPPPPSGQRPLCPLPRLSVHRAHTATEGWGLCSWEPVWWHSRPLSKPSAPALGGPGGS